MNCKNCNHKIEEDDLFCENCGAKVITHRITLRLLINEVLAAIGLNNLYFTTLKKMLIAPNEVLNEYLNGVRKRYLAPFAFLAIGAGFSYLIFNLFPEDYIRIQSFATDSHIQKLEEKANKDLTKIKGLTEQEYQNLLREKKSAKKELDFNRKFQKSSFGFILKNFNLVTFLFIPFYALISFLVYRKPHNFGEHIIINAYIQGTTFLFTGILFIITILTSSVVNTLTILSVIIYYIYVYQKLYNQSIKQVIFSFLKFILVLVLLMISFMVISFTIGILIEKINQISA